ncbi:MAG: hypothetical protein WCC10_11590 [Tumebacillaceae bacterium]
MRLGKMTLLALSLMLVANTLSACNFLRTPYERQKINENGGVAKKKSDEGADTGGGGKGEGGKEAGIQEKKKKEEKEKFFPNRAETKGEQKERMKGQGVLFIVPKKLGELKEPKKGQGALGIAPKKQGEQKDSKTQGEQKEPKKDEQKDSQKGAGLLGIGAKTLVDKTPKLSYEQQLSAAVSQLEGVGGATVLLDDEHRAYVAISSDPNAKRKYDDKPIEENTKYKVKTEGDIPATVQERIAVKLRAMDSQIGLVNITDDPHHADTLQRYAVKAAEGKADDVNAQALADHIQDIWK